MSRPLLECTTAEGGTKETKRKNAQESNQSVTKKSRTELWHVFSGCHTQCWRCCWTERWTHVEFIGLSMWSSSLFRSLRFLFQVQYDYVVYPVTNVVDSCVQDTSLCTLSRWGMYLSIVHHFWIRKTNDVKSLTGSCVCKHWLKLLRTSQFHRVKLEN